MKRTDIHCPSKIVPQDYEFICIATHHLRDLADAQFIQVEFEKFKKHSAITGGSFSRHEHGGSCHCCGASATYILTYYHVKSNSYVHIGHICAEKLDLCQGGANINLFRKNLKEARALIAGKYKAKWQLGDRGLLDAWTIYEVQDKNKSINDRFEEKTIWDIVSRLVRYGRISEKQEQFLRNLLYKIAHRAEEQKLKEEKRAAASEAPTGRVEFRGTLICIKVQDSKFGCQLKMLVESETGYKAWGTCPSNIPENAKSGDSIYFVAQFQQSKDDSKFAYFKRPTQARLLL